MPPASPLPDGDRRSSQGPARRLWASILPIGRDALHLSFTLFRIMIPIIVAVKVLQELDAIRYLAWPLQPVMHLVGLPAEMGLVWATAMLNNIYTAMIVLLSLAVHHPLTAAQATVLGTMVLVAHTLPVELKIAQKSGPRMLFQAACRLLGAIFLGWILNQVYTACGMLQQPARFLLAPESEMDASRGGLWSWAWQETQNLLGIMLIIFALLALMAVLRKIGVIALINRLLAPVLRRIGIGPQATAIMLVGLTLGISYGGALIIHEARRGEIDPKDVFYALTLMGLCHSLLEDTLLMVMMGSHLSGVLLARLIFALLTLKGLVMATERLPRKFRERFLWRPQPFR